MFDEARKVAKGRLPNGPFKGVPFLLKDLLAQYAGARYTECSAFPGDYISEQDSELVTRLKKTGLVILGKTNAPEFGILPTTEPKRFGPTRNPWDTNRTTGGSSGGSAAAVASRMVPFAHGNDGGGSIRIPSSCCGLFGLKPTRGRNPLGPELGDMMGGLVCEHVLTISVRDSAAILDATGYPDVGDPYCAPPPERSYLKELKAKPKKLRIGFTTEAATDAPVHKDCRKAVMDVVKLCEELGHELEKCKIDVNGDLVTSAFITVFFSGFVWAIDGWARKLKKKPSPEYFEPLTWALYQAGKQYSAADYLTSWQDLQKISRDVAALFVDHDVILTPTLGEPPLPLGSFDSTPENPMQGFMRAATFVPFTPICNITGQPAMNVPLYWNSGGLPIGLHFIGRFGDEGSLFRLAAQLEKARPWKDRKPPVCA
jgi:amidase